MMLHHKEVPGNSSYREIATHNSKFVLIMKYSYHCQQLTLLYFIVSILFSLLGLILMSIDSH